MRQRVDALIPALTPAMQAAALNAAAAELADAAGFHHEAIEAGLRRERLLAAALPSAAKRLVQAGLFDRREILMEAARSAEAAALRDESRRHVAELERTRQLATVCELEAVILTSRRCR